jgi:hypothetical protein
LILSVSLVVTEPPSRVPHIHPALIGGELTYRPAGTAGILAGRFHFFPREVDEMAKQKWPSRAVKSVQAAIDEWNTSPKGRLQMHIVWGYANKDDEQEEASQPKGFNQPEALLQYANVDYQLRLVRNGDPSFPDRLIISTTFPDHEQELEIPTGDAKKLFNILSVCDHGVQLRIIPGLLNDGGASIIAVGCEKELPAESLTARILQDALYELSAATALAFGWLAHDEGDDWWTMSGGQ